MHQCMQIKGKTKDILGTAHRLPPLLPSVDERYPATFRELFVLFCGNSEFVFTFLFHNFSRKKFGFS